MAVPYPSRDQLDLKAGVAAGEDLFTQPTPVVENSPGTSADISVANQRQETHFKQAEQHSTLVGLLKKTLPVLALLLVVWFVAMGFWNTKSIGNISVKSTGISNGMLVMESPKLSGFNRENRPYDLVASRAKQDLKNPGIIKLENLHATIPMQDKIYADIKAKTGIYDSDKEWLSLNQEIEVKSQDGTSIFLSSAEIDLSKGSLSSQHPVFVSTSNTTITANQVEVTDNGEIIIFKQRVRMTVTPSQDSK